MTALTAPTTKITDTEAMRIQTTDTSRSANKTKLMGSKAMSPEKLDEVAQQFESQFISQMLENMFSTVDTKGFMSGGDGEEVYRSMMIDQYGKIMSRAGGIGVADHVKRQMLSMQEVSNDAA